MMLLTILAFAHLPQGLGRPSYLSCATTRTVGSFITSSMGTSARLAQAPTSGQCDIVTSSLSGGYVAGQTYSFSLSSDISRGLKMQASAGSFISGGSGTTTCRYNNNPISSVTYSWAAPASGTGTITFQALCGRSSGIYITTTTISEAVIVTSAPTATPTNPTANPVTQSPTANPVTPSPTANPVTPSPTGTPLTSSPTVNPVTSSPTANPVTSNPVTTSPTVNAVTSSPTANPVTSSPTVNPVTSSPTANPVTTSPTAKIVTSSPTANPVTPSPTVNPVTSSPTANPMTLSPTVNPVTSSPTVNGATRSPTANPVTLSPTVNPVTSSPTVNGVTLSPTANPVTLSPTVNPVTSSPTVNPVTSSPTAYGVTLSPTANPVTLSPTANPIVPSPTVNPVTPSPNVQTAATLSPTASNRLCVVNGALEEVKPGCTFSGSANDFRVEWAINSSHILVKASARTTGYVGMGWGTSMPGSFAVLGWCTASSRNIQEYFISARSLAGVSAHGSSYLSRMSCTEADGRTTIRFLRPLSTQTGTISLSGVNDIIYASQDTDRLSRHSKTGYGRAQVNFETGQSEETDEVDYVLAHSSVMWLAFSLLMPLGVAAPIFFRDCFTTNPGGYFKFQMGVQFLAAIFIVVGFVLAFYVTENDDERFEDPHGQLGLALIIFAFVQIVSVISLPAKADIENTASRTVCQGIHKILGAFVVIGGLVNCSLGLQADDQAEDIWKALQWIWTAIVLILGIGGLIYIKGREEKIENLALKSDESLDRGFKSPRVHPSATQE